MVIVRPWTDGRAGGGCCGGEVRDGVARIGFSAPQSLSCDRSDPVGQVWRRLCQERPDLDVQVVDAGNPWLIFTIMRGVRRRVGMARALRALRGATPGAVLLDGLWVANLTDLEPDQVLAAVDRSWGSDPSVLGID